jgi:hypothetical protein
MVAGWFSVWSSVSLVGGREGGQVGEWTDQAETGRHAVWAHAKPVADFARPALPKWTFLTTLNADHFTSALDDASATTSIASTAATITAGAGRRWREHSR